jgi:hypothetical protein
VLCALWNILVSRIGGVPEFDTPRVVAVRGV